ncbi:hypothetical protein LCI18_009431 [Fusarium solani-melongenae]|uniref:Uncharacterized protein n=1 Tax=Fusarium solani subsp. cucurbitae TaxID=2747967 RepID=A0ACD3ZCD7_FUSSC|nr:hypothetical protein LCI18_009431 [Fusarium solani-melongenae]
MHASKSTAGPLLGRTMPSNQSLSYKTLGGTETPGQWVEMPSSCTNASSSVRDGSISSRSPVLFPPTPPPASGFGRIRRGVLLSSDLVRWMVKRKDLETI